MHIINFCNTDEPQEAWFDILVQWVIRANFKQAVQVAFVYDSKRFLRDPLEARCEQRDCSFAWKTLPDDINQVLWKVEVDKLSLCFLYLNLPLSIIEIELVVEVWGEEVGHTSLWGKPSGISLDVELGLPANLLTVILLNEVLWVCKLTMHINCLTILVNIYSLINCCMLVIDNFKHPIRIFAKIEALFKVRVDIPLERSQSFIWLPA